MKFKSKTCCVPVCRTLKNTKNKLIPFPKNKNRFKCWVEALGIEEEEARNAFVCVLHFRQTDFVKSPNSKDSKEQKNRLKLEETAVPSRNLLNPSPAAINLKTCSVKITRLPTLKKVVPLAKTQNKIFRLLFSKKQINGYTAKPKSMQLNNKLLEKLVNTPDCDIKEIKDQKDGFANNSMSSIKPNGITLNSKENSTKTESLNNNKTELKSILKKSNSKQSNDGKNIKKKVRIKTKLGQFMPKIGKIKNKVIIRDQIKTNKKVINYEVIEQINDCNVLIMRM